MAFRYGAIPGLSRSPGERSGGKLGDSPGLSPPTARRLGGTEAAQPATLLDSEVFKNGGAMVEENPVSFKAPRTANPLSNLAVLIGLLAVGVILLFQQLIGRVLSLGVPLTIAVWLCILAGELLAVGVIFSCLKATRRPILPYLRNTKLKWWEFVLVPLGLFAVGQVAGQLGGFVFAFVAGPSSSSGQASAGSIIPKTPVEYALVAMAAIFGGGFSEEFIFRSYLISAFSKPLPKWLAAMFTLPLFGLIHVLGFGWVGLVELACWAIPITVYVVRTDKLLPAMVAHALNDLLIFAVLLPLLM